MTKNEFVDQVAAESGLGKGEAGQAVDAVLETIKKTLSRGGEINFTGFGKFSVADRSARQGVNPVSGTFSVGASGRLIENGRLGAPVREITIASDLVSMLKSVRLTGSQARWVPFGGSVKAPPLLVGEMAVSGS